LQNWSSSVPWHEQLCRAEPGTFLISARWISPIHGEIIDAEHIGSFLHGIGEPLGCGVVVCVSFLDMVSIRPLLVFHWNKFGLYRLLQSILGRNESDEREAPTAR